MSFDKIRITDIIPAPYNPRIITDTDKEKLQNSLTTFGLVDPIILNLKNNHIIGGHQRFNALLDNAIKKDELKELNLIRLGDIGWAFTDTELTIDSDEHEKALNVALNKINGEWDIPKLEEVFTELELNDFNIELTGFSNIEIEDLNINLDETLKETETISEDEYEPEEEINVTVKKGEIYQLGEHRLMCGDSTDTNDLDKLMNNNKAIVI